MRAALSRATKKPSHREAHITSFGDKLPPHIPAVKPVVRTARLFPSEKHRSNVKGARWKRSVRCETNPDTRNFVLLVLVSAMVLWPRCCIRRRR
ncbi:hypothetical protein V5799_011573 [Amblyomma americanum]|uniref:Uncharacterized protein n=1 Tax=Amblyomma americanum TaxID=6943 RepID=A0AAQ4EHF6_AMBAM